MQNELSKLTFQIAELLKQKDFDEACSKFRMSEFIDLPAGLLLQKATAIQLARDSAGYTLEDARQSLVRAVSLEPNHVQAWLDLGHFYFAVDDNLHAAVECFERVEPLYQKLQNDLVIGRVKTLRELGRTEEAKAILRSIPEPGAAVEVIALRDELLEK